jgi:hypothetical protein
MEGVFIGGVLGWQRGEHVVLRQKVDRLTRGFILGREQVVLGFLI